MKTVWEKIAANASDAKGFVEEVSANGIEFLRSNIERIPLLSSTHADVNEKIDRDETHYFLVPNRHADCDFVLYTIRSLPPGVTPVNSLEKARIFHLHDPAGVEVLESLLISDHQSKIAAQQSDSTADFATRLDDLAEKIDTSSNAATGGFIIVGTLVAIANPLLGAGIALSSLVPSLGSFATTSGIKAIGDKFRKSAANQQEKKSLKQAELEVKRLKPEILINPVLKDWQLLISTNEPTPEVATVPFEKWNATFANLELFRLTARAVEAVFKDELAAPNRISKHTALEIQWLREVCELAAATSEPT